MTHLLVVLASVAYFLPGSQTVQEFSSKESCEAALALAKTRYATVDKESYCISIEDLKERQRLVQVIEESKKKLREKP